MAGGGCWGFPARVIEFSHSILCLSYEATKRGGARGMGSLFSEANFPRHGMDGAFEGGAGVGNYTGTLLPP